jgi:hypothetical protein
MPKLAHNFVQGKMSKDLDERLVPSGQYRDALNIQVSSSEGSDVGAVENILGNQRRIYEGSGDWDDNFGLTSPKCIGIARDTLNDKIYWFITAADGDAILEYTQSTNVIDPVIVDVRSTSILNFNVSNFITGINILDGMLFWTDNLNEPRKINIEDYKTATAAVISSNILSDTTSIHGREFKNSDITVIKPSPKQAIDIVASSTKSAANPERGVGVIPVTVTVNLTDSNGMPLTNGDTVVVQGLISPFIAPSSAFNNKNVKLIATETKSDGTLINHECIATLSSLTAGEQIGQFNGATLTIVSLSATTPNTEFGWEMTLVESEPIFKNDFPRFSYRWKFKDGEYSTYAPFSEAAFVTGQYSYEPKQGYNIGMDNAIRKITLTFPTSSYATPPENVTEIEVLYKGVASNNIYVLETHLTSSGTLSTFVVEKDLLGPVVESLQLLRLYDNVPRKAKAQEVIANRLVYGNYVENFTLGSPVTVTASTTDTALTASEQYYGQKSVKSDRSYQVGVTFLDEFNRETPVFTNKDAAIAVDIDKSNSKNKISASTTITSVPSWAEYYKYYVKDSAAEYYNIGLDRFYDSDDGNIWLSFPSSERNKVQEGDFLVLKKAHGLNTATYINNRYKVLDIKNEAPPHVRKTNKAIARAEIIYQTSGFDNEKITFKGPTESNHRVFHNGFTSSSSIQFQSSDGTKTSAIYGIRVGGPKGDHHSNNENDYELEFDNYEGLLADDAWLKNLTNNDTLIAILSDPSEEALPEFQGKFFAKVNRNASFELDIAANVGNSTYATVNISTNSVLSNLPTLTRTNGPKLAYGYTANSIASNPPTSGASDTTFDLILYTGWVDDDDSSDYRDFSTASTMAKAFNQIEAGTKIRFANSGGSLGQVYNVTAVTVSTNQQGSQFGTTIPSYDRKVITVDRAFSDDIGTNPAELQIVSSFEGSVNATPNPAVFEVVPIELADLDIYYEATDALEISGLANTIDLDFKNCYAFGNGVESNRIRDDYNAPLLGKGVRVSTTLQIPYKENRRANGLIYSGIVNSRSGVNESNQFTTAINITKDLPVTYGGVQKLHARDTDLIALCEDKCFKILANKDALFSANGDTNITSSNNVLGQTIPFAGEYGISKNPESFASFGFRSYFTDKARGAVIRLSRDGITDIAGKGMADYFEDKLKAHSGNILGTYDEANSSYNLSFTGDESVSFKENSDGWVTRLSFVPEAGLSLNNEYFTVKAGELWQHNNSVRSNFYGTQYNTTVTPIFNDAPSSIKNFKTLSYEGDTGWVADVLTDQQDGEVEAWKTKENLHYNYIKGKATTLSNIDTGEFSVQGLGNVLSHDSGSTIVFINGKLNVSLQNGDTVYSYDPGNTLRVIGTVLSVSQADNSIRFTSSIAGTPPVNGDFMLFAKDSEKNTSGIIGYHASIEMKTSSSDKKELFAVNSEVFISS